MEVEVHISCMDPVANHAIQQMSALHGILGGSQRILVYSLT